MDIEEPPQILLPTNIFANIAKIPSEIELQTRIEEQLDHNKSLSEILKFLRQGKTSAPPSIAKGFKEYQLEGGLLMYQNKVFVPDNKELKQDLISAFHDAPAAGHPGQQRTLELVSRHYHWPGI